MSDAMRPLRTYEGDHLREISMPIGGTGTGSLSISGRGALVDWQLMNRPNRGWKPMYSHFLVRTNDGSKKKLRILEGDLVEGKSADSGHPAVLAGVPRFPQCKFESSFPLGKVILEEPGHLRCSVDAFNPLIPGDTAARSLPYALFTITVENLTDKELESSLSFIGSNIIGCDGVQFDLKDNVTKRATQNGWSGMHWTKARKAEGNAMGDMVFLCDRENAVVARRWVFRDQPWNGEQQGIIRSLLEKGTIADDQPEKPCPPSPNDTWDSSVSLPFRLGARSKETVRFLIAWRFPWIDADACSWKWSGGEKKLLRNHYGAQFKDSKEVAAYAIKTVDDHRKRTEEFVESVLKRAAPAELKEAALFNLAHLKSPTVLRLETGEFLGFEGCNDKTGCCMGSCTHVWNYEEATIRLFPDLHRSMLESHLRDGITDSGGERFRLSLPLVKEQQSWTGAAADGQMGLIVRLWEQFTVDKDRKWLAGVYPKAKNLLEFAWVPNGWDADKDGVMEGVQHNTYDVEFYGPNPLCSVYYLAAIRAVESMARELGDLATADSLHELFAKGSKKVDETLYNGSYYIQQIKSAYDHPAAMTNLGSDPKAAQPPFQVGQGCLIDQLVGQYKANRCGLGPLLDPEHIRTAAKSIFKHNHRANFREHYNNMRSFAIGDESGTIICDYPTGTELEVPLSYWGECMNGFEYALAVLLLDCGLKKEGAKVAGAVRGRHNGSNRNPFNEPECGSYYARSMAAWALLDAWDRPAPPFGE